MTEIWYKNPEILFKNLDQFIPNKKLSKEQNINSIVRFAIYFSIIILILNQNIKWLLLSLLLLITSYYLDINDNQYSVYFPTITIKSINNEKPTITTNFNNYEDFTINNDIITKSSINNPYMNHIINNTPSTNIYPKILPNNLSITSLNQFVKNDLDNKELNMIQNNTINYDLCLTSDNNKLCIPENKTKIDPDSLPKRFKINDELKKEIKKNYKTHLKFDSIDIWGQLINDRNYYTLPNTELVNDQSGFAEWCYTNNNQSGDCKTYGVNCVKDRDVRYHRGRILTDNK